MRLACHILKFNIIQEYAYPTEIVAFIIRKFVYLGFRLLFWQVISKTNPDIFSFKEMLAYFLIAGAVQDLTFVSNTRLGRDIQKMIKAGTLSNYFIKPIDTLRFLYLSFIGSRTSGTIFALMSLTLGIILFPPQNSISYLLFVVSLLLTAAAGAGMNILMATVGFYSPEAGSIHNVYDHISNILSGQLVPLAYFPGIFKSIALATPFPILAYYPTTILQRGGFDRETFIMLGLSLFWATLLLIISNILWKKAVKNYDGVGI
jgi:ABC-2 type transport system permease protein